MEVGRDRKEGHIRGLEDAVEDAIEDRGEDVGPEGQNEDVPGVLAQGRQQEDIEREEDRQQSRKAEDGQGQPGILEKEPEAAREDELEDDEEETR
jgi:hypothetical protein